MPIHEAGPAGLRRDLNVWHATSIVAGTIIGSGIFLVPAEMMRAVGTARLVYLAWIVGGVLSFFGALTYAELGSVRPWAGGEYVYIRDAYGPLAGFLYAWTWFLIAKPGSIASITSGLVRILGNFAMFGFLGHPILRLGSSYTLTWGTILAIVATVLISALNYHSWTWFLIAMPESSDSSASGRVRILGNFAMFGFLVHPILRLGSSYTWRSC